MEAREIKSAHSFTVTTLGGKEIELSAYAGKVLLIVNTASACALTPQYTALQSLYEKYAEQGLEILAFPSNDFGKQEPLEGDAIQEFCSINFRATFPLFDKIKVKGPNAHPLFQFLSTKSLNQQFNAPPRWNFQKYLLDRQGRCVNWFYPFTSPKSARVCKAIEKLL